MAYRLRFEAQRVDGEMVVRTRGTDSLGEAVDFAIAPDRVLANLKRTMEWAHEVAAVERVGRALIEGAGLDPEAVWTMLLPLIPGPIQTDGA